MQNSETITVLKGKYEGYYVGHPNGMNAAHGQAYNVTDKRGLRIGGYASYNLPTCCGGLVISGAYAHDSKDYDIVMEAINTTSLRQYFNTLVATAVDQSVFDVILKTRMNPDASAINRRTMNVVNTYAWSP